MIKSNITRWLPYLIIGFVLIMLGSLKFGWLNCFFYSFENLQVQGIDFFCIPKSFLNLLEGRSPYDTFGGTFYGPYATWYLAHPAFSVFVGSWFSFFSPWKSYALFVVFSLAIMIFCAYLLSTKTSDLLKKQLCYVFLLCAFPTYGMLYVGNMHAPLVLALTLILMALYELAIVEDEAQEKSANRKLMAGLLISFFTKPVVFLMLPLLLLTKETRRTTFTCLVIYGLVSALFIFVPLLNPEGVGISKLLGLNSAFIKENMNVYKNHMVLNEYMKDNSIHWLNLVAQSDYRLMHIDIYSLSVFTDTLVGYETPAILYKLPIYISMLLSVGVLFIPNRKLRLEATLLTVMAISLTFFLSYNTVWEYQFTSVLPLLALLPILKESNVFYKKFIPIMLLCGSIICLPSFYIFLRKTDLANAMSLNLIRCDRVIPVLLLFLTMIYAISAAIVKNGKWSFPKMSDAPAGAI